MVRQDARGNTNLIFGDGQQGARLPSGREQITASYRIGIGPQANLPAGSLNQLQTGPPGIESVVNPLPATGGVEPEELAQARQRVPVAVRRMNRIVSLADFEDFARLFAGVGKAQARLLHAGQRELLHITIADGQGQPVPETSDLFRNLVQAIDQNRSAPHPEVRIGSYQPVYFNVRARLLIDPDHQERQAAIEEDIRLKISQAFAFDQREFGQDVTDSELITLMQDTPGVVAVELVHLHRSTQTAGLAQVLEANPARWHADGLLPAEMLLVNSQTGITLNVEGAT
jgi:predicted phage baseplate assembly protein